MLSLQKINSFLSFHPPPPPLPQLFIRNKHHKRCRTFFERGGGNPLKRTYVDEGGGEGAFEMNSNKQGGRGVKNILFE